MIPGSVEQPFGGEERAFMVRLGELRRIEDKCDEAAATIATRLARCVRAQRQHPQATMLDLAVLGLGDWHVDEVREPILQGLIGGGMKPNDAGQLVRKWIDDRGFVGLLENVELALTLVVAGTAQPVDDPVGEPGAGAAAAPPPSSASPPSMEPAAP